jgi:hypothetical protein
MKCYTASVIYSLSHASSFLYCLSFETDHADNLARGRAESQKELQETTAISLSSDPIGLRRCVLCAPSMPLDHEGMCVWMVYVELAPATVFWTLLTTFLLFFSMVDT